MAPWGIASPRVKPLTRNSSHHLGPPFEAQQTFLEPLPSEGAHARCCGGGEEAIPTPEEPTTTGAAEAGLSHPSPHIHPRRTQESVRRHPISCVFLSVSASLEWCPHRASGRSRGSKIIVTLKVQKGRCVGPEVTFLCSLPSTRHAARYLLEAVPRICQMLERALCMWHLTDLWPVDKKVQAQGGSGQ